MAAPRLKELFKDAVKNIPTDPVAWPGERKSGEKISISDLNAAYPRTPNFNDNLRDFLYGTGPDKAKTGFLPRFKTSFDLAIGKVDKIMEAARNVAQLDNARFNLQFLGLPNYPQGPVAHRLLYTSVNRLVLLLLEIKLEAVEKDATLRFLKANLEETAFQEWSSNADIAGLQDRLSAMNDSYGDVIRCRDSLERDFEFRRTTSWGLIRGADAWTKVTARNLREAEFGRPFFFDFQASTYWYNLYNLSSKSELDRVIVPYVKDIPAALALQEGFLWRGMRSLPEIDEWVQEVQKYVQYETKENRTNHGWEKELVDAAARQHAISKCLNGVYKMELDRKGWVEALKPVADNIDRFRRDAGAVIQTLGQLINAIRTELHSFAWDILVELRGIQSHLWAGEPEAQKKSYDNMQALSKKLKSWVQENDVALSAVPFYPVAGKSTFWKSPPSGSSSLDGVKPPKDQFLQTISSLDVIIAPNIGLKPATNDAGVPYAQGEPNTDVYMSESSWLAFPSSPNYRDVEFGYVDGATATQSNDGHLEWDITFKVPFAKIPNVVTWLTGFNFEKGGPIDISTGATDITTTKMKLKFDKAASTKLVSISLGWLADASDQKYHAAWTTHFRDTDYKKPPRENLFLSTADDSKYKDMVTDSDIARDPTRLVLTGPKPGSFEYKPNPPCTHTPTVIVGINRLRCDTTSTIRLKTEVDLISTKGYTIRAYSSLDTRMYEAGLTIIVAE